MGDKKILFFCRLVEHSFLIFFIFFFLIKKKVNTWFFYVVGEQKILFYECTVKKIYKKKNFCFKKIKTVNQ